MKVVHVLKKIETIDQDVKELRKLEKAVKGNKAFTTPIIMSIEKQINILLGDRIKLLELKIENPPESMFKDMPEETDDEVKDEKDPAKEKPVKKSPSRVKIKEGNDKPGKKAKSAKGKAKAAPKTAKAKSGDLPPDDDDSFNIPILTQEGIDAKIARLEKEREEEKAAGTGSRAEISDSPDFESESVKLLDIALEKGSLGKNDSEKPKDKKIRFFRDNFPAD